MERHCEAVNHISEAATHIMSRKGEYQSRATPAHASPRTKQVEGGIEGHTHSPASQNRRPHSCVEDTHDRGNPVDPLGEKTAGTDLRQESVLEDNAPQRREPGRSQHPDCVESGPRDEQRFLKGVNEGNNSREVLSSRTRRPLEEQCLLYHSYTAYLISTMTCNVGRTRSVGDGGATPELITCGTI